MRKFTQSLFTFALIVLCLGSLTGCTTRLRVARHEQRGDKYFAGGEYTKAEVEYLTVLRIDVLNNHAISQLAQIYFQQGRFRRAFPFIQKACELNTNNIDLHVKLATLYLTAHHGKEAREVASSILKQSPTNADAPHILAESATTTADLELVKKQLENVSKQTGQTAPMELAFGILAYSEGDAKTAQTNLQHAVALDPKSSAAYNALGNLYFAQNNLKEAEPAFKMASELAPIRSFQHLSYANFKIQTGDLAEGKRLIAEITKNAPDYMPAWIREAEIALAEKDYSGCESRLNQALALDSDNYEALFLRGRMFLMEGQADKAVAEMDRMAALFDQSAEVQYQLALAHLAAKDPTKAAADLNKALSLQPKYPNAILLLAELNLNKGDSASAISALSELLRQQPAIFETYVLLGAAYMMQKDFDKALSVYGKAAPLFPKNPQIPFSTAVALVQKRDFGEARKFFEKSLELSPKFIDALEGLINLDLAENKFADALDRVNKETDEGIGADRELLIAKIHLARARSVAPPEKKSNSAEFNVQNPSVQQDINLAETALLKAIDLAPTSDAAYFLLSQLYISGGKDQAALDQLNKLVSKTNNATACMQMAVIYDSRKDYENARQAYEKALAINPDFSPALNNLSYLYLEHLGNVEKAYPLAQKARQLLPNDPSTADTLGWVLYKKGDYVRARSLLEESAAKMPNQPEIQFHVGMARYMLGDEAAARVALQQAAAGADNYPGKTEATRRLAILAIDPKSADTKTQADLEKWLQGEPNDPIIAERLGAIYERGGALAKAANTYEQSLKQAPQNAVVRTRLARIYIKLNQMDKALDMAKEAHKLSPADAAISAVLGRLVFQSGDYNWAASLLQDAALQLPSDPEVQYSLAWSYYSIGRVSDAEKTMQSVTKGLTKDDLAGANELLSMIAAAKSPAAESVTRANQILSTNSDYVPAMMVVAMSDEQKGKPDEATRLYLKALKRFPGFSPAERNLAVLCSRNPGENDQKAYDAGSKARAMYPDDTELSRALGVLAYRRGDYNRAAQLLQASSQTQNTDAEGFYYLGMARYQLKQSLASKAALQRALAIDSKSKWADDARKVLAELK